MPMWGRSEHCDRRVRFFDPGRHEPEVEALRAALAEPHTALAALPVMDGRHCERAEDAVPAARERLRALSALGKE